MVYTRRHFTNMLQAGAVMTAAGFQPARLAAETAAGGIATAGLDRRRFAPLVGSAFRVTAHASGQVSLTLLAVEDTTPSAAARMGRRTPAAECSCLRFSVEGGELAEGSYVLRHDTAGEFLLHLNPGRPGRYLAYLAHVPAGYLATISIPRRALRPTLPASAVSA